MATKKTTKADQFQQAVSEAVGAGKELHLESVDFSDPNRPKTCLEVDFPILPINCIAAIEGNAGKPIYQMSKWWARRRSSVFRAVLIAAATKAPDDIGEAAKIVWDSYYGNHQKNEAFQKLKVADIFMGGGTTVVEGSRLGMTMYGNDLNPVAWLIVKNELSQVEPNEVQALLDDIEGVVKPQIMPFFSCDCPRGHKGKWTHKPTGEVMGGDFDPLTLTPDQRLDFEYAGPEIIYTFWAKHGPCQATECNHRTPIVSTPVLAVKTLTVKTWSGKKCRSCEKTFDVEQKDARMAPKTALIVADSEAPFCTMDDTGNYACPHCGHEQQDPKAATTGESASLGKGKNKKVSLTLLIHPNWLKGTSGKNLRGEWLGGGVPDSAESTAEWSAERSRSLRLIEVRGQLPETITCPDTKETFFTDKRGGTIPKSKQFKCKQATCGLNQDILVSVMKSKRSPAFASPAIQGYCPECDKQKLPYNGRFFDTPRLQTLDAAVSEWETRRNEDLRSFWPTDEIPHGYMTPKQNDLPGHGFTHWWMMFNPRQLLSLSLFFKNLDRVGCHSSEVREAVLSSAPQLLRYHCLFTIWQASYDKMIPHFSNNNYYPKATPVEGSLFGSVGAGNFDTLRKWLNDGLSWCKQPWEIMPSELIPDALANGKVSGSLKLFAGDPVTSGSVLTCGSSTELSSIPDGSVDAVITDPPFERLVQYSELADFFYVWIRPHLASTFPAQFGRTETPKTLEAVSNPIRNPDDPKGFYQRVLTQCWKEAWRILKPGGMLAFTFHHSEDDPWVRVLESLFSSGFYLEAAYPIRSDETKGTGQFGSKQIEFDIVHVCRKRLEEPESISWARLRRQIMKDVRQLQEIIEQHQQEGLGEADLQVIRRGKALEYYSRHYGKVYIEKGREDEFTVKDALVGINQLLDDESDTTSEAPPRARRAIYPAISSSFRRQEQSRTGPTAEVPAWHWSLTFRVHRAWLV